MYMYVPEVKEYMTFRSENTCFNDFLKYSNQYNNFKPSVMFHHEFLVFTKRQQFRSSFSDKLSRKSILLPLVSSYRSTAS